MLGWHLASIYQSMWAEREHAGRTSRRILKCHKKLISIFFFFSSFAPVPRQPSVQSIPDAEINHSYLENVALASYVWLLGYSLSKTFKYNTEFFLF